jgi:hypothetical protein
LASAIVPVAKVKQTIINAVKILCFMIHFLLWLNLLTFAPSTVADWQSISPFLQLGHSL